MTTLMTPDEVSIKLKITVQYVWQLCRTGALESYKVGTHYRISEAQLENYLRRS